MFDFFTETPYSTVELFIKIALNLGLVLLIIFALNSLIRHFKSGSIGTTNKHLSLLETMYLSPKQKIYLVRVSNKTILLSSTEEHIAMLGEVALPAEELAPDVRQMIYPKFLSHWMDLGFMKRNGNNKPVVLNKKSIDISES